MSKAIIKEEHYQESNVDFVYQDMEVMTDSELNRLWYVLWDLLPTPGVGHADSTSPIASIILGR